MIIGWSSLTKYEQKLKLLKNHSENVLNRAAQRALEYRSQLAAMTTQMRFNVNMLAEKLKSDMQDLTCQSREVEVIKLQKQATQPTTLLDLVLEPLSHPLICIPPLRLKSHGNVPHKLLTTMTPPVFMQSRPVFISSPPLTCPTVLHIIALV